MVIVGGGLAGLTLGIGLRQRGVPVTVWEAGHYPRHKVCGEFISGRGQAVLARMGLADLLIQAGAVYSRDARFFAGGRSGPVRVLHPPAISLSRYVLDAVLARRFRECGGELLEDSHWQGGYGQGIVRASGRCLQVVEDNWRWFGLKIHARNVALTADLEIHGLPDGYVGLSRLAGDVVNLCGLFRRRSPTAPPGRGPSVAQPPKLPTVSSSKGHAPASREAHWKDILRGPAGTLLHARLDQAILDADSFCSVAGLGLRPRRAGGQAECRIGDALTMTPPVTGNGMSMAFEAAELAVGPLAGYSRSELPWNSAQRAIARACDLAFTRRLAWANCLQRLMFAPVAQSPFGALVLNSGLLWRFLFAKTRS